MPALQNPVIVLPGITATSLHDEYPTSREDVWTMVMNQEFDRLKLHPDNLHYEAIEPAHIVPGRLFGTVYGDLISALRYDLTMRADHPTPVFAFPYDWRHDIRRIAERLRDMVEEVVARTSLLRHYKGYEQNPKVDLVAHSMGGLVACEYLSAHGGDRRIGKVVTLGTPYLGSLEAVVKLVTGMGNLSGTVPKPAERESARSTPAVYQLLPSFDRAVVAAAQAAGVNTDLFNVAAWQPGIIDSLAEYVRLHAVDPPKPKNKLRDAAVAMLSQLLTMAHDHRARVRQLDLTAAGLGQNDWLVVAGAHSPTRVQLQIGLDSAGQPRFSLSEGDFIDQWTKVNPSWESGDGTVPLRGAIPPFLDPTRIVVVTPDDFGFWEWKDRALYNVAGFHALLPNLNLAQRLALKHLRPAFGGDAWGRPVPDIILQQWQPPIPNLEYRP